MNVTPIVNRINSLSNVERGANALGMHPRSFRKLGQPDDGKFSPIQRFADWAEFVTSQHDPEVNNAVLELLRPVLDNMELTVFSTQQVEAMRKMAAMLVPGDNRLDESRATTLCPRCAEAPLEFVPGPNIFHCRVCGGR